MPRDSKVYLEELLEAARKIRFYTAGLSFEAFCEDSKTADAVIPRKPSQALREADGGRLEKREKRGEKGRG